MEDLIGDNYNKVNFRKNPLLYILAVADSLEPYKLFSDLSIDSSQYDREQLDKILNSTYLNIFDEQIIIKPPSDCVQKLRDKLDDMKNWVDIDYDVSEHKFTIQLVN